MSLTINSVYNSEIKVQNFEILLSVSSCVLIILLIKQYKLNFQNFLTFDGKVRGLGLDSTGVIMFNELKEIYLIKN